MTLTYNVKEIRKRKIYTTFYIGLSVAIDYIQFSINRLSFTRQINVMKYILSNLRVRNNP